MKARVLLVVCVILSSELSASALPMADDRSMSLGDRLKSERRSARRDGDLDQWYYLNDGNRGPYALPARKPQVAPWRSHGHIEHRTFFDTLRAAMIPLLDKRYVVETAELGEEEEEECCPKAGPGQFDTLGGGETLDYFDAEADEEEEEEEEEEKKKCCSKKGPRQFDTLGGYEIFDNFDAEADEEEEEEEEKKKKCCSKKGPREFGTLGGDEIFDNFHVETAEEDIEEKKSYPNAKD